MNKEQAIRIKQGEDWELICEEIDRHIERQRSRLEVASEADFKLVQERLKSLKGLKRLPQDVIDREAA